MKKLTPIASSLPALSAAFILIATLMPASQAAPVPEYLVIPVRVQAPEGYPGNPSPLVTPLRQDLKELRLQRRTDGLYDLSLGAAPGGPTTSGIDLRSFVPRVPDLAKGNETLTRIALTQREYNRNEVSFGAVAGADDLKLANNCLRAGLWEVMLVRKIDGSSKLTYHGWFTFPREEYSRLFEEVNGIPFSRFESQLAAYPAMGGFKVPLKALRSETAAERIEADAGGIAPVSDSPALRFGEQTRKAKLVLNEGLSTYGDFQGPAHQPVSMARFSEPGLYDSANPVRFDLGWLKNPLSATWRSVSSRGTGQPMKEVTVEFANGYRIVVGDESIASLPARSENPRADGDVLRLTFGISTPEISLSVSDRMAEFQHPRSNYLFLLDGRGRAVDNHQTGVDRVFLWRESGGGNPDRLHILLVGYERIAIVGEITIPWMQEAPSIARR